jgi:hypothetical protein
VLLLLPPLALRVGGTRAPRRAFPAAAPAPERVAGVADDDDADAANDDVMMRTGMMG